MKLDSKRCFGILKKTWIWSAMISLFCTVQIKSYTGHCGNPIILPVMLDLLALAAIAISSLGMLGISVFQLGRRSLSLAGLVCVLIAVAVGFAWNSHPDLELIGKILF